MKPGELPEHLKVGELGEKVACEYLKAQNFSFVERNYWKKWGEIDLIMRKKGAIHFVEVKTVSYETVSELTYAISHGTYRPEDRVDHRKLVRLRRVIETWVVENKEESIFQLDLVTVRMVPREKYAVVDVIENIEIF